MDVEGLSGLGLGAIGYLLVLLLEKGGEGRAVAAAVLSGGLVMLVWLGGRRGRGSY